MTAIAAAGIDSERATKWQWATAAALPEPADSKFPYTEAMTEADIGCVLIRPRYDGGTTLTLPQAWDP